MRTIIKIHKKTILTIDKNQVYKLVRNVFFLLSLQSFYRKNYLHLYFVSKKRISQLHNHFFFDPSPTDCITLPVKIHGILGEIFICPQMAIEYDALAPYKETSLYIIHGILHLLGYNDTSSKEKKVMKAMERRLMNDLMRTRSLLSSPSLPLH